MENLGSFSSCQDKIGQEQSQCDPAALTPPQADEREAVIDKDITYLTSIRTSTERQVYCPSRTTASGS